MTRSDSRFRTVVLAVSLLTPLACGDKKDDKPEAAPSGERTKDPVPETPKDAPKGPFAGFDFEAAKTTWQGSWVLEGESVGTKVAWMIDGEQLVAFDGTSEKKLKFTIYSPCQVTTTDEDAGMTSYTNYAIIDGQLHAGLGSSGTVVDGGTTIVCTGGKTYVLADGKCEAWSEMFDDWKSEPADCKIEGEGAERKFVANGNEVPFVSDTALATAQLKANVATKQPNFDAAKQALAQPAEAGAPG